VERARTAALYIAISVASGVLVYAAYALAHPPYSDYEIKASIVDTWRVEAFFTFVLLVAISFVVLLSLVFCWRSPERRIRRLSALAVLLCISSSALLIYSHIVLTERTARLTGQSFGGFYGLF
jgi:cytochrome bd-type quinol oxidase subunit 1